MTSGPRWRTAAPFLVTGAAAIVAGGFVAAAVAHDPSQPLVWMSAYLVLVVGVAQLVFGGGQAMLAGRPPSAKLATAEWLVFNLGNAGVIAGTLLGRFEVVLAGTALFAIGIALFLAGTRGGEVRGWLVGYRIVLGLIFASSLVGLSLSAWSHLH